jgi:hypothetical protein
MWKRLSDADISKAVDEEKRRRSSWRWPVLIAVLMAAACAALWSFGFRGGYIASGVVLMMGPVTRLTDPSTLGIFTIVFGLVLFHSRRKMIRDGQGLFGGTPTVLCNRCQKAEAEGASPACECGGSWEPIGHWEWTDRTN